MKLNKLTKVTTKKFKKVGRGYGSGKGGHTVGKGQKGQASRSGFRKRHSWIRDSKLASFPKLRGIGKRSAKRGYYKSRSKEVILNIEDLAIFKNNEDVSFSTLKERGLVNKKSKQVSVKILGRGELKNKLNVRGIAVSKTAKEKIESAGGTVK